VLIAKAEQFLGTARGSEAAGHNDASLLAAVHAAIAANDAVCVALLGQRSSESDHMRAAELLEQAAQLEDGVAARARQLRALLEKKSPVAYQARRTSATEARDGLARATRFVEWAVAVIDRAKV
jgi:HEPN domain-containing protein